MQKNTKIENFKWYWCICYKAKISRRIQFWGQNWAISNRFLAKLNFSYFLWFFVFFEKSFRKLIWNRFFRRTLLFLEAIYKFWWTCSSKNLVSYFPDECSLKKSFLTFWKLHMGSKFHIWSEFNTWSSLFKFILTHDPYEVCGWFNFFGLEGGNQIPSFVWKTQVRSVFF